MKKVLTALLATGLVLSATPAQAAGVTISGSGSTAVKNLLDVCIPDYQSATGNTVNYAGGGSGAGRAALTAGTVDFAFSDAPYGGTEKKPADFLYIPAAQFPVAVFANLKGFKGKLNLSVKTVTGIFGGQITKWNDKAIVADNKGVKLPKTAITVWYRSDKSGTTGIFTNWLTKQDPMTWSKPADQTFTVAYPGAAIPAGTFQGAQGSDLVASGVASKDGSIGYAETSYATERKLVVANIQNNSKEFVAPNAKATALFNNGFKAGARGTITVDPLSKVKGGYTLAGFAYGLAYGSDLAKNKDKQAAVAEFMTYVLGTCAKNHAVEKGYSPITGSLLGLAQSAVAEIK
jgi:phosphate transport system substrate-binding protein